METRFKIDSSGKTRVWNCWNGLGPEGSWGMFTQDGVLGGKLKEPTFKEAEEKNIGRANYLACEGQSLAMVSNAASKKEKNNYFLTESEAAAGKLFKPMLAAKYEKFKGVFPVGSQPKLDGGRCDVYWCPVADEVVIRTRSTKDYVSVPHILAELVDFCTIHKDLVVDGELYNHKFKYDFEKIMSLIRQSKPSRQDLFDSATLVEFHVYDICDRSLLDTPFTERTQAVDLLFNNYDLNMVVKVETTICDNQEELDAIQTALLEDGYEGQMVRILDSPYKVDGRSVGLLKRKEFTDEEFEILDVLEGTGQWAGAAKKLLIQLPNGNQCKCGIDGSYEINAERLANKDQIIGKLATVRYLRYSQYGMLNIPVCKDINRHD